MIAATSLNSWLKEASRHRFAWRRHQALRDGMNEQVAAEIDALKDRQLVQMVKRLWDHPYFSFTPRPDSPADGDEQTSYVESRKRVTVAVGGNGSGKSHLAAMRTVDFITENLPPKRQTPIWIVANTMEQVCRTCWNEKLSQIIPSEWVDWGKITWLNRNRNWPRAVPLVSPPGAPGRNWVLEFKSYEEGRDAFQAASIAATWFTEQFPWEIFEEVIARIREYSFPGCIWTEFTPIDPEKSVAIQDKYEKWVADPTGNDVDDWSFHHLNTEKAAEAGHVTQEWLRVFVGTISEEMRETRVRGAFARYEGAIYQSYRPAFHCVDEMRIPEAVVHKRSIDWGSSEEHAFVVLWGYKDSFGHWHIYDEYYSTDQTKTIEDHCAAIQERHEWPANNPWYRQTYGDPSEPGLMRLFATWGVPVQAAKNAVYDGIETVRRYLKPTPQGQPQLIINRANCPWLARQMTTYRWERSSNRGVNPRDAAPRPLKKDDHAVDALRYLLHSDHVDDRNVGVEGHRIEPARRPGFHRRVSRTS